eukprot:10560740-Karenia_brevis.AAC.1
MDAFIDANAVYDSLVSEVIKMPVEKTSYTQLLAVRDAIERGWIRRLSWMDTNDMLSDGLTKGTIDREALLQICTQCSWQLK